MLFDLFPRYLSRGHAIHSMHVWWMSRPLRIDIIMVKMKILLATVHKKECINGLRVFPSQNSDLTVHFEVEPLTIRFDMY